MKKGASKKQRVYLIDEFRGLVILLMVFYHTAYDLVYIFSVDFPLFHTAFMHYLQVFIAGTFIIVSGISCRFSQNNLKRGLITLGLGLAFSLVTALVMPEQIIKFGVLHLLGCCMILFALFQKWLDKIPALFGCVFFIFLQVITLYVPQGYLGYPPFAVALPDTLYQTSFLFWLGFPAKNFFSSDFFPLIPWLFLFLGGSFLGVFFKNGKAPKFSYQQHVPFLSAVGKHTLWIYLLHQPIIYGVLLLLFKIIG